MKSIRDFLELIKFEHTIFALPFAYLGMLLAAWGFPSFSQFFWITLAMVAARTLAMSANRITDRWQDARNPRTAARPLVTGKISPVTAWTGTILAAILLAVAAWQLGPLPFRLLPGAYLFLFGYSFTKRFTWMSHFILGFTDGLAPVGAWAAVRGSIFTREDLPAWILLAVVTLWIGGFDLIYACQDIVFDRREGLQSVPARFGAKFALSLSTFCHVITVLLLAGLGAWLHLGWPYWVCMVVVAALLAWEHRLVRPEDLSRINLAFFNINSYISIALFLGILGSLYLP
ncbi:MAG: 4-hydroxybenzoate octaprenyltransferase [Chloroflexota bacterium]|nr:MAG: 4-hydroxybenzoate octaprenyltransferase [Chloroflexota bacterium]